MELRLSLVLHRLIRFNSASLNTDSLQPFIIFFKEKGAVVLDKRIYRHTSHM